MHNPAGTIFYKVFRDIIGGLIVVNNDAGTISMCMHPIKENNGYSFAEKRGEMINIFEDSQEMIGLYQAIDSVKKQFGEKFLFRAACI